MWYHIGMNFDYVVADPTGNITVLITTPYTDGTRQTMIRRAFELEPSCEQVGFMMPLSDDVVRLEMMGYEFCGNATLSAAAWHAGLLGLKPGEECTRTVSSSGAEELLSVKVSRINADTYQGTVSMPVPEISSYRGYPLVRFEGISHLIVPSDAFSPSEAESAVRAYADDMNVPALGMMLCSEFSELVSRDSLHGMFTINPLVYVPGSGTVVWEHGCATGSTAIGWYRYSLDRSNNSTAIKQPGGIIRVDAGDGQVFLTGQVRFI